MYFQQLPLEIKLLIYNYKGEEDNNCDYCIPVTQQYVCQQCYTCRHCRRIRKGVSPGQRFGEFITFLGERYCFTTDSSKEKTWWYTGGIRFQQGDCETIIQDGCNKNTRGIPNKIDVKQRFLTRWYATYIQTLYKYDAFKSAVSSERWFNVVRKRSESGSKEELIIRKEIMLLNNKTFEITSLVELSKYSPVQYNTIYKNVHLCGEHFFWIETFVNEADIKFNKTLYIKRGKPNSHLLITWKYEIPEIISSMICK